MQIAPMTQTVPRLFDERLRRQRKQRARALGPEPSFLHEAVTAELADRLDTINRTFPTFLWHGAPELSQRVATAVIPSDVVECSIDSLVFQESEFPIAAGTLDAYASTLTLHAVNDLPGALAQIRRALKPDGYFIAALFGARTLAELRQAFMQAENEIMGGVSPRISPLPDVREAGALLQRAGFALPVADADEFVVHYTNPMRLFRDLRQMGETNVMTERLRRFLRRDVLARTLEICARHIDEDGRLQARFEIIYLSGWSPHDSQQKPLKPGSARKPLSEALDEIGRKRGD